MPNKYEREIEEILRNMDRPEPKTGLGSRIRAFNRPRPRRARRAWDIGLSASEVFMLVGIAVIMLAAGLAYFWGDHQPELLLGTPVVAWISIVGFAVFVAGLVIGWRHGFNSGRAGTPSWRGPNFTASTASNPGTTDGNVVRLNSRRNRNPFTALATRIRILRLKMRYQRLREHENSED